MSGHYIPPHVMEPDGSIVPVPPLAEIKRERRDCDLRMTGRPPDGAGFIGFGPTVPKRSAVPHVGATGVRPDRREGDR